MNNIEVKSGWNFKEGGLIRFVGIFLPVALLLYLDMKYELTTRQYLLFSGLYVMIHGIWAVVSKRFPIFMGRPLSTINIRGKKIGVFLIIVGFILIFWSFK